MGADAPASRCARCSAPTPGWNVVRGRALLCDACGAALDRITAHFVAGTKVVVMEPEQHTDFWMQDGAARTLVQDG